MHLLSLHTHGSNNPLGLTGNLDRLPMHPYFVFKDLVTVLFFILALSFAVFYAPNALGQYRPLIIYFIIYSFNIVLIAGIKCNKIANYNKTKDIRYTSTYRMELLRNYIFSKFLVNCSPFCKKGSKCTFLVRSYYKSLNQQITKMINAIHTYLIKIIIKCMYNSLKTWVGISETTRTTINILYLSFVYFTLYSAITATTIAAIAIASDPGSVPGTRSASTYCSSPEEKLPGQRAKILKNTDLHFNQWLAGLIDGDGYLYVTKEGNTGCEITVALQDEKMLRIIQNKLGGSVKPRSGCKAVRYRLQNKLGMIELINRINGLIRNTVRTPQLYKVAEALTITVKDSSPIQITTPINSSWYAGFFDADGTINFYMRTNPSTRPQLTLSVANKYRVDLEHYQIAFGGSIYFDKAQNGCFKWSINSKELHLTLYHYFKEHRAMSIKSKRIFLIKEYYDLVDLQAYKHEKDSAIGKAWANFEQKWNDRTYLY